MFLHCILPVCYAFVRIEFSAFCLCAREKNDLLTVKALIIKNNVIHQQKHKHRFFLLPVKSVEISRFSLLYPPTCKNFYLLQRKCNCWLFLKRTPNKCARTHTHSTSLALPRTANKARFFVTHSAISHVSHNMLVWHAFFRSFRLLLAFFYFSDNSTKEL